MNFKEIRLVGFKSFADKTCVRLDDGVTCIVGPNGCGKSNVADAVRWVLGEQSAKTLRGSSMQDVIFGGTESRRSLSYCEVTLVFDNSQKLFDTEYEEIALTRRLYRSGESRYLINDKECRLRQIVTILHSAGIGKEGYSIIGQGKVEQIMNAKPEDRRAIFEEATGVMQFKIQRGEIERKIASSKDNLMVFLQRFDEVEKQITPLEKQAETAKKHNEYSRQLKYEEVNTFLVRTETFEEETERERAKIREANEKLEAVENRLVELDVAENEGKAKIGDADALIKSLQEERLTYEVGMERKSGQAKLINERMESYRRRLTQARDEVDYSVRRSKEIDRLTAANAKKAVADEKREREIGERSRALGEKLAAADARVAAFEKLSDEKRASELSSVENLADLRANVGSLSARRDAANERLSEVGDAIRKAELRRDEFSRRLEECRAQKARTVAFLDSKDEKESELAGEIAELTRSEQRLSQELVDCNTSIANLQNNLEMYVSLKNRFEGYRDSVRRLQQAAKDNRELGFRIKGAIADIVRTDRKYEVAIETAFGGAMQNLVTATADDARYLIEHLKRTNGGIVTFLPVGSMAPRYDSREAKQALGEAGALGLADELVSYDGYYDNVVKNLLGNTLVCDTIMSATAIARKFPHAFKIVTLDGDTVATSGAMTGGSRKKDSGNLLAGERRIKECEEGIAKRKAAAEKLRAAIEDCGKELDEARAAQEKFRLQVQEQAALFAALSQQENIVSAQVAEAEADASGYRRFYEELSQKKDNLENEVLSSAESEDLLNKIRSEAAAEAAAQEEEITRLKAERDGLYEEFHALQVESAKIASERRADEETKERLSAEQKQLIDRRDRATADLRESEQRLEALKIEEEKAVLTEEEQAILASIRTKIAAAEEAKREENARQSKLAEEKRSLQARRLVLGEDKHACEIEISKAQTTLENMRQRLDEAYGLAYESAKELRDPNYDISQSAQNINSLRHKIGALGNHINFNAVEEYAELVKRHTEMQTQKTDLEQGLENLEKGLTELKDKMREQFDAGFKQINENFTSIFRELFGGGRAQMQLDYTDCEDPLDAGVDIVACPPGKKLTKISLLSGGERAFTAIAILFAILKSRPMPFCILDEIEAALDEANVDRFARYLKKFSKETQFIVITHRKPTMNQADSLFGVTMEEKGVSKIVSVKLSEVESRLGGDTVID